MSRRSTQSLTKRLVDSLKPDPNRDYTLWDSDVTGFGIRVKETGARSFVIKYRNGRGQQRKSTLGKYGHITVEGARRMARAELGKVAAGDDPVQEHKIERSARTISDLCNTYMNDANAGKILHRGKAKKPTTLKIDQGRIDRHIIPLLGGKRIDELRREDIEGFMFDVRDGKTAVDVKTKPRGRARVRGGLGTAKKAVSLLSAIYTYAIRRDLVEHNPCQYVQKPADNKRVRFLSADEYAKLGKTMKEVTGLGMHRTACAAIIALALTGCRRGEVLNLNRDEVDPSGNCLRLGQSKTGPQLRPCGDTALTHLQNCMNRQSSSWVFPADGGDGPLINIRKPMMRICEMAELNGVTPHVLRHSYATVAHELGYSELTIAGLLGHSAGSVTSRYAHHVDHVLSGAADKVSETIAARLGVQ